MLMMILEKNNKNNNTRKNNQNQFQLLGTTRNRHERHFTFEIKQYNLEANHCDYTSPLQCP